MVNVLGRTQMPRFIGYTQIHMIYREEKKEIKYNKQTDIKTTKIKWKMLICMCKYDKIKYIVINVID